MLPWQVFCQLDTIFVGCICGGGLGQGIHLSAYCHWSLNGQGELELQQSPLHPGFGFLNSRYHLAMHITAGLDLCSMSPAVCTTCGSMAAACEGLALPGR